MTKATVIKPDGETYPVEPKNGTDFKLEELYAIVGDPIEVVYLDNEIMVINEEGKLKGLAYNAEASHLFWKRSAGYLPGDHIVGTAIVMPSEMLK